MLYKKQKILIVDDSEMNREILMGLIGGGYDYVEAGNGVEALDILRRTPDIDLMLLDIIMPVMDGIGVLELMQEKRVIRDVPVIIISTENSAFVMHQAYKLGAIDYISRPFDTLVVQRRLKNTLMLYDKEARLRDGITRLAQGEARTRVALLKAFGWLADQANPAASRRALRVKHVTTQLLLTMKSAGRVVLTGYDTDRIGTAAALLELAVCLKADPAQLGAALLSVFPEETGTRIMKTIARLAPLFGKPKIGTDAVAQAANLAHDWAEMIEKMGEEGALQALSVRMNLVYDAPLLEDFSKIRREPELCRDEDGDIRRCVEEFLSVLFAEKSDGTRLSPLRETSITRTKNDA